MHAILADRMECGSSNSVVPLFQLYSFLIRNSPFGLKGPFSENAPTPREEQPGPEQNTN